MHSSVVEKPLLHTFDLICIFVDKIQNQIHEHFPYLNRYVFSKEWNSIPCKYSGIGLIRVFGIVESGKLESNPWYNKTCMSNIHRLITNIILLNFRSQKTCFYGKIHCYKEPYCILGKLQFCCFASLNFCNNRFITSLSYKIKPLYAISNLFLLHFFNLFSNSVFTFLHSLKRGRQD